MEHEMRENGAATIAAMMGRWAKAAVFGAIFATGCAALVGIEDTKDVAEPGPVPEAGADVVVDDVVVPVDAGSDAGDLPDDDDAGPVIQPVDSGPDDGGDPPPPPDAGACNPTSAFVPVTGADGTVCNAANILAGNSGAAGLDYAYAGGSEGHIDGRGVTSCVGAEFAKVLTEIVVRASSSSKGCDFACGNGFCGTGDTAYVFAGSSGVFKYIGGIAVGSKYADFHLTPPAGLSPHEVVVCRAGSGGLRDDIDVYSIFGTCLP
jgi:hypothetical protein